MAILRDAQKNYQKGEDGKYKGPSYQNRYKDIVHILVEELEETYPDLYAANHPEEARAAEEAKSEAARKEADLQARKESAIRFLDFQTDRVMGLRSRIEDLKREGEMVDSLFTFSDEQLVAIGRFKERIQAGDFPSQSEQGIIFARIDRIDNSVNTHELELGKKQQKKTFAETGRKLKGFRESFQGVGNQRVVQLLFELNG